MAKILRVDRRHPRRKKWEHFKMRSRIYLFRASYLTNLAALIYLADQQGRLTTIIVMVNPILEAILKQLPHIGM